MEVRKCFINSFTIRTSFSWFASQVICKIKRRFTLGSRYIIYNLEKKKTAPVSGKRQNERPKNNLLWDTNALRIHKEYITQVSEEILRRIIKKYPRLLAEQFFDYKGLCQN